MCKELDKMKLNGDLWCQFEDSDKVETEWFVNTEYYYYRIYHCPFCGAKVNTKGHN